MDYWKEKKKLDKKNKEINDNLPIFMSDDE